MRLSVCVMADIDEMGLLSTRRVVWGSDSAWVTDSQMLFSRLLRGARAGRAADVTAAPRAGVAICGTRIPPVHVAALATLNRLAPGRVHLGMGTGNTAMRTMGQPPMRIADYAEYLRVLRGLLRGETVDYAFEGKPQPIKMLIREKKYMSLQPRIPLYVSAFGPRAMEVGGQYGDGLVIAIPPRGLPPQEALERARIGAQREGRELASDFHLAALTNIVVLEPGEACELRAGDPRGGAERDGERLLLLRYAARARRRAARLPAPHLEALRRPRGADAGGPPALPHARGPLHLSPPRRRPN
jgi:alkanesulfonate monooxygenase SsuD/methylene tetrahydromethanopterin reductase-like flavin-dependent oxidoreductase (luciferase family)